MRYILNYESRKHLNVEHFVKVRFLDVDSRIKYLSLSMMHKIYYGKAPSYLCNFEKTSNVHDHETRNSLMSYVLPEIKTHGRFSFRYNGAKLWNHLPLNIRELESKDLFKTSCKKHLLSQMYEKEENQFVYY